MNSKNSNSARPTSPHLQIYKWNICSITSIMHRFTGVALFFSIIFISWFVVYYAYQINTSQINGALMSENCDCPLNQILNQIFILATVLVSFSLYYHFCNGIRHLFWDFGKGFELKTARRNGYLVILVSLILTVITIAVTAFLKFF